ncbi:MAG: acylneuraminate cytidylyltransferase family protein [Chloroflexi bacterium]|nr:acylneuraminate cytidylyltransferase family protein [Chloroflexota bacterium]
MSENGRALAIIPARGGSKGVPGKNVKLLGGIPLIAHSILAAQRSLALDRTIVSTDDDEIADVARDYGAEVPFKRPADIAADQTPDLPVFQHALRWLDEHEGYRPDFVIHLRPTQPFRPLGLIDEVVTRLRQADVDCVKSLAPVEQHPHKMWRVEDGWAVPFQDTLLWREVGPDCARQLLEPVYWSAGLVDGIRAATVLAGSTVGQRIAPLFVASKLCPELDLPHHFISAEVLLAQLREEGILPA